MFMPLKAFERDQYLLEPPAETRVGLRKAPAKALALALKQFSISPELALKALLGHTCLRRDMWPEYSSTFQGTVSLATWNFGVAAYEGPTQLLEAVRQAEQLFLVACADASLRELFPPKVRDAAEEAAKTNIQQYLEAGRIFADSLFSSARNDMYEAARGHSLSGAENPDGFRAQLAWNQLADNADVAALQDAVMSALLGAPAPTSPPAPTQDNFEQAAMPLEPLRPIPGTLVTAEEAEAKASLESQEIVGDLTRDLLAGDQEAFARASEILGSMPNPQQVTPVEPPVPTQANLEEVATPLEAQEPTPAPLQPEATPLESVEATPQILVTGEQAATKAEKTRKQIVARIPGDLLNKKKGKFAQADILLERILPTQPEQQTPVQPQEPTPALAQDHLREATRLADKYLGQNERGHVPTVLGLIALERGIDIIIDYTKKSSNLTKTRYQGSLNTFWVSNRLSYLGDTKKVLVPIIADFLQVLDKLAPKT